MHVHVRVHAHEHAASGVSLVAIPYTPSRQETVTASCDIPMDAVPLQAIFGWSLIDEQTEQPTLDAWVFLGLAVALQLGLLFAVTEPLRQALATSGSIN